MSSTMKIMLKKRFRLKTSRQEQSGRKIQRAMLLDLEVSQPLYPWCYTKKRRSCNVWLNTRQREWTKMRICQSKGLIDDGNEVDTTATCFAGRVIFNPGWHWFLLKSLHDWSRNSRHSLNQSCKTNTNHSLVARVFPHFRRFACFYFEFSLVLQSIFLSSDWLFKLLWFLVLVLRHSIEKR